ncbi:M28 family peptidase [Mucilaginibacter sp. L3T2-6]|uniref:M28 family peptidase n=1 Tax=Mucilaginibacter sp. L3T2-6 TaxID=3062491 RepID=UPI0026758809|nr:M28 family peptidase [Mucilaginibacter sp. L3T2-6]MDO3643907.1 M28 family peptidase [Mucilaginibacter sp. L3T2-6]MDV6216370.1 M28 family peptidase [Mucilaginibacter sp. L3T2-6]
MKKIVLPFILAGLVTGAMAQQNPVAMKYAKIVSPELAKKHLSIIASDEYEGRETGKPGADKAAHYIANEFKSVGLQPIVNGSYFFDVPLSEKTSRVSFTANGQTFESGTDFYAYKTSDEWTADASEIVFVGYGTEAELGNTDLSGKVVLWVNEDKPENGQPANTGFRGSPARVAVLKNILAKNPAAVLAANGEIADVLKKFKNYITAPRIGIKKDDTKPAQKSPAVIWITTAMADQLVKSTGKTYADIKAAAGSAQVIKADVKIDFKTVSKDVKAVDVLGFLPGSDPKLKDEVLVISAHYDHIGLNPDGADKVNNGADDDGSGTTAVMELARAFSKAKKDGHGPRRSILFLGNVGEEKGLLGSEYYTDHPVIPLEKTIADLNIDMVGRVGEEYAGKADSANTVYVIGSGMLSTDLHKVNENANNTYTKMDLDYKYDDPKDPNDFYHRSDHYNFAKHGVPIIFYFNGVHKDYHQPGDEVSKINFPLLAKRAQLVFYTAWDLANADKRPVVDGKVN